MVEDRVIKRDAERPRVVELLRIDARSRIARDVADVVRAGPARGQPRLGDTLEHGERALRRDLPALQLGARGDVRIAAAELLGDRGYRAQLVAVDDAVRVAQPAHERVLRRCDVEQAVKLVQEDVGPLRELALGGIGRDLVPHVEGMLCALRLFFAHELAARGEHAVLRVAMNLVGTDKLGFSFRPRGACNPEAAAEAFQVALLLFGEVAAHQPVRRSGSTTASAVTGLSAFSPGAAGTGKPCVDTW